MDASNASCWIKQHNLGTCEHAEVTLTRTAEAICMHLSIYFLPQNASERLQSYP